MTIVVFRDNQSLQPFMHISKDLQTASKIYLISGNGPGTETEFDCAVRLEFTFKDSRLFLLNDRFKFDRTVVALSKSENLYISIQKYEEILLFSKITFDKSFFIGSLDYTVVNKYPPLFTETYPKKNDMAILTSAYNESTLLTKFCVHHEQYCPAADIYVIDHGSLSDISRFAPVGTNFIRIPRTQTDHLQISTFSAHFQRFLLTGYTWVLRLDVDELLLHRNGPDGLRRALDDPGYGPVVRPTNAVEVIDNHHGSLAFDMSSPVSTQGVLIMDAPLYRKPVLSSIPVTWAPGFHDGFGSREPVADPDLWLVHLRYCDLDLAARRERKVWMDLELSPNDAKHVTTDRRTDSPANIAARAHAEYPGPPLEMPEWMVGQF